MSRKKRRRNQTSTASRQTPLVRGYAKLRLRQPNKETAKGMTLECIRFDNRIIVIIKKTVGMGNKNSERNSEKTMWTSKTFTVEVEVEVKGTLSLPSSVSITKKKDWVSVSDRARRAFWHDPSQRERKLDPGIFHPTAAWAFGWHHKNAISDLTNVSSHFAYKMWVSGCNSGVGRGK